jgi:hypothetical protein
MDRACTIHGEEFHTGFWWGNLMEGELLGRPSHRWEHNIIEVGWGHGVDRSGSG